MTGPDASLGMILKGYPRISESFISTEILLLESLGLPIRIFSLRQPRETFSHDHVKHIKAPVTYLPEYVWPNLRVLLQSNRMLWGRLGAHYARCFAGAVRRAWERKSTATVRHFLQAGHLSATRLADSSVRHLHAHFCHTPTSVAFFASELTAIPFSFTAHAKDIYTSEPDQLLRKVERARFVVTCTRYNARYLMELARANGCATPIHTIYHGIDLDLFAYGPPQLPAKPFQILSIGRLVSKKGWDVLLAALKILREEGLDFRLTHIGSGDEESDVRRLVEELQLSDRVRMLGTLPHSTVIDHYHAAHCFALACKVADNGDRDGIPNVLVEAMAVGLPVVSTRVSAIPELVEDGVTGRLVEPERPDLFAGAIRETLARSDKVDSMVRAARARVEESFDNRRCVQRLHPLLKAALAP